MNSSFTVCQMLILMLQVCQNVFWETEMAEAMLATNVRDRLLSLCITLVQTEIS